MPKSKIVKPRRRVGPIPKLVGNKSPKDLLFFDTETFIEKLNKTTINFPFRLGVAIYVHLDKHNNISNRSVHRFNSSTDFIDIIKHYTKANKTLFVFAHNIKFDIMVLNLPFAFFAAGITTKYPIINERMFIWRAKIKTGTVIFVDTANYGVISVAQLGKDIGIPKMEVDFVNCSDDDLYRYCVNDTHILEEFMLSYIRFCSEHKLGSFRLTLASQSLAAWRTSFMRKTVHIHNYTDVLQLERAAYHGGRTECFALGTLPEQDYFYLDVNSMYPFVMKTCPVPIKFMFKPEINSVYRLYQYIKKHYIIADVMLETKENAYPLVMNDKLIFPVGRFRTTLNHCELEYAMSKNHVVKVYDSAVYERAVIFGYYVDFFYELKRHSKETGNTTWYLLAKLLQNSLYGKMAQTGVIQEIINGEYKQIIQRFEGHTLGGDDYQNEINWFGTIIREKREGESSYSFPAAAAAITSNARMLLYKFMASAGFDNVYYVDTDSLIINADGYRRIENSIHLTDLGKLKLENQSTKLVIYGNKDYEFGDTIRHKGITPKATLLSPNQWSQLQFEGILPWLSRGGNDLPRAKTITKSRKSDYNKGEVNYDTGRITPIFIWDNS